MERLRRWRDAVTQKTRKGIKATGDGCLSLLKNDHIVGNSQPSEGEGEKLGRPRVRQDVYQLTTDPFAFGCDLFARFLTELHHEPNEFEGAEQTVIVLVVDDDGVLRRQKLLADVRECLLVKLLACPLHQEELKEVISQHDKDDLIDNHREGTGGEMGQIIKAFKLSISLFYRGAQMVFLLTLDWVSNLLGVD